MKTFMIEGKEVTVPDVIVVDTNYPPVFEIIEGDFIGIQFKLDEMRMDDKEENVLMYDLFSSLEENDSRFDSLKVIVDNFIMSILVEQTERIKNEASEAGNPDT